MVHLILSTPYAVELQSDMPTGQNNLCRTVSTEQWCTITETACFPVCTQRKRGRKRCDKSIKRGNWLYMPRKPRELVSGFYLFIYFLLLWSGVSATPL